jgi:hypothetical protein
MLSTEHADARAIHDAIVAGTRSDDAMAIAIWLLVAAKEISGDDPVIRTCVALQAVQVALALDPDVADLAARFKEGYTC